MKIGTRGSKLALIQTSLVAASIEQGLGIVPTITIIKTQGDRVNDRPLSQLEGRGFFTKDIEKALLSGQIDLAVHSFKDVPSSMPDGLAIVAVTEREDPADLLVIRRVAYEEEQEIPLKKGVCVGTSAIRRSVQLKALRPDIKIKDLRGNVITRLQKLSDRNYDAIFLAAAGVNRLGISIDDLVVKRLSPSFFVPSPGQGALAVQMRTDDVNYERVRSLLHDDNTGEATTIEREVMSYFGGGCGLPLGVYTDRIEGEWNLYGFWGENRKRPAWADVKGDNASELVSEIYQKLNSG